MTSTTQDSVRIPRPGESQIPSQREQQEKIDTVYGLFAQAVDFSPILNNIRATLEAAEQFKRQEGV